VVWSCNVAGTGTLKFDEVAKSLGKRELNIPSFILFPFCELLWKMGIIRFPSSILNLIKYPWVGDISNLQEKYGYIPRHSSREALNQFVKG
jgi:UDP-glucose 4-epimerase